MSEKQSVRIAVIGLRVAVVVALGLSAFIHLKYAHFYRHLGNDLTQGTLFKLQGVLAIAAALLLVVNAKIPGWGAAFSLLAGSFGAILVYRYVNVGTIGPLPNMYEPIWDPQGDGLKVVAAIAEGAGTVLAAIGLGGQLMLHRKKAG